MSQKNIQPHMKLGVLGFAFLFMLGACTQPLSNRERGAVVGGGAGAAAGAVVGAVTGAPGTGALIGGAVGATGGAIAGDQQDRNDDD